jgi:pSer/pThr/pTyr-binding forkhead associated (FHA) protein
VSRRHAELRTEGGRWSVVDLGSTNGIKVNGRRVDKRELSDGDKLTLGVTDLTFELD